MYINKTSKMILASVLIPFYFSSHGDNLTVKKYLTTFSVDLGLAFQLCDDILDVNEDIFISDIDTGTLKPVFNKRRLLR